VILHVSIEISSSLFAKGIKHYLFRVSHAKTDNCSYLVLAPNPSIVLTELNNLNIVNIEWHAAAVADGVWIQLEISRYVFPISLYKQTIDNKY